MLNRMRCIRLLLSKVHYTLRLSALEEDVMLAASLNRCCSPPAVCLTRVGVVQRTIQRDSRRSHRRFPLFRSYKQRYDTTFAPPTLPLLLSSHLSWRQLVVVLASTTAIVVLGTVILSQIGTRVRWS